MNILLTGGLNLNDPVMIGEQDTAISLNADYRQDGIVRSRSGFSILYSSVGSALLGSANGHIYSYDTAIYVDGVTTGTALSGIKAVGRMHLYNSDIEAQFIASDINYKIQNTTVSTWGTPTPSVAPTITYSGTGLTGTFYFKYTYVKKVAGAIVMESNPSPKSLSAIPSNQSIVVTYTAPVDSQVTHVRFYRTINNGAKDSLEYYYDGEVATTSPTYTTNVVDGALGSAVEIDNDAPPLGITSIAGPGAFNSLFVGVGNNVYFSKPGKPESFPADYYITVGTTYFPIMHLVDWGGVIYVFTKGGVYYLQGSSYDTYIAVKTMTSIGLFSKKAIRVTEGGIIYLGIDGLYVFNGQTSEKITGHKVDSIFRGDTINGITPLNKSAIDNCWIEYFNGKVFFGYPDSNETVPNKVLMYDTLKLKFSVYDYNRGLKCAFVDETTQRLLFGDGSGNILRAEYGVNDNGSAFTLKLRGRELNHLESSAPRVMRQDIYNEGGNTVYMRILSDGVTSYEYSFTTSDKHRRCMLPPLSIESMQIEVESSVSSTLKVGVINLE